MRRRLLGLLIQYTLLLLIEAQTTPPAGPSTSAGDVKQSGSSTSTSATSRPQASDSISVIGFTYNDIWSDFRDIDVCRNVTESLSRESEPVETSTSTPATAPEPSETSATAVPTDIAEPFISFEDWKKIKQAEEEERESQEADIALQSSVLSEDSTTSSEAAHPSSNATVDQSNSVNSSNSSAPVVSSSPKSKGKNKNNQSSSISQSSSQAPSASPPPPVPHHNRYNYASPDCSARIHSSSPQTQHASSLLHKSRDRYMLTPCKAKEHWVVVELCDEIRIEAIEIAIWEFFSSVVREVRVSVGGEDDEDFEDDPADDVTGRSVKWKEVGSFVGKNVRGVQTFTLSQPTSFHRFIRLDFPTFYGTEYYCPVSQLKVYGMNQMEAFKWEQKRLSAASKGKNEAKEKEAEERRAKEREEKEKKEKDEKEKQQEREKELDALEKLLHEQAGRVVPDILSETAILSRLEETVVTKSPASSASTSTRAESSSKASSTTSNISQSSSSTPDPKPISDNSTNSTTTSTVAITTKLSSETMISSSSTTSSLSTYSRSSPPRTDSSESIYAFIIRRLNDLEGNSTLVARYIEEQAKVMRHMLTRVEKGWDEWKGDWEGEDRGRWEQERMRQEDRLGKVISQLEQQRSAFEEERKTLQSQMRGLAEELGYERRRGLAQLFVMFIIIILGTITRSSNIDAVLKPLLAEAKRRRSIYGRKSFSGPLTGLRIDMGEGRPPAVIGQGRPKSLSDYNDLINQDQDQDDRSKSPTSPTPTSTSKTRLFGKSNSTARGPGTPNSNSIRQRRVPPGVLSQNFRSVSASDQMQLVSSTSSPIGGGPSSSTYSNSSFSNLTSPKPRGSLSSSISKQNVNGNGNGVSRKLAKSAHLHTIDSDRRKLKSPKPISYSHSHSRNGSHSHLRQQSPNQEPDREFNIDTPKRPRSSQVFHNGSILSSSPSTNEVSPFTIHTDKLPEPTSLEDDHTPSEWGTDVETEASVSEVEDEVFEHKRYDLSGTIETDHGKDKDDKKETETDEMVKELTKIWNSPSLSSKPSNSNV